MDSQRLFSHGPRFLLVVVFLAAWGLIKPESISAQDSEREEVGTVIVPPPADLLLPEPAHNVSLSELEEMALRNNPTMQQAAAEVMRLNGVWLQVGLRPNPLVGYQAAEVGNNGSAGQQGVFIGQEFVRGGKLDLNRSVAASAVQQARWQQQTQRHRVLNTVRRRYYHALGATKTVELAAELQELAEEAAGLTEKLEKAGEASLPQVLQAQIEAQSNLNLVNTARVIRQTSLKRLAVAVGMPDLLPEQLEGDIQQTPPELDYDSVWSWVQESSPELQAANYSVQRARRAIERAEAEPIPNLDAQVGMAQDFSSDDTIVNIQLGFKLPYHNQNQGNIKAAQAEHIRACREIERLRLELRDRLATAYQNYENSLIQMKSYRDEILPRARKNLELARRGYEGGELDYLPLLTAQRTFFQQSIAAVNAQTSLWLSVVQLQGLLIPAGLGAPGEVAAGVSGPDESPTLPLGQFPMILP